MRRGASQISPPDMERLIWQKTPQEIVMKILESHMPLPSLCRLQTVCKMWFYTIRRLMFHGKLYILYSIRVGKSVKPSVKPQLSIYNASNNSTLELSMKIFFRKFLRPVVSTSSNTWLLFTNELYAYHEDRLYFVCNIFEKKSFWLPNISKDFVAFSALQTLSDGHVVVVKVLTKVEIGPKAVHKLDEPDKEQGPLQLQVYNSRNGAYNCKQIKFDSPETFITGRRVSNCSTLEGSILYFMTINPQGRFSVYCIDVLHIDEDAEVARPALLASWTSLPTNIVYSNEPYWFHLSLAVSNGRIFMGGLGAIEEEPRLDEDGAASFVATMILLKLDMEKKQWEHLSSLPNSMVSDTLVADDSMHITAGRGEIAACTDFSDINTFACVYDIATDTWFARPAWHRLKLIFPFEPSFLQSP